MTSFIWTVLELWFCVTEVKRAWHLLQDGQTCYTITRRAHTVRKQISLEQEGIFSLMRNHLIITKTLFSETFNAFSSLLSVRLQNICTTLPTTLCLNKIKHKFSLILTCRFYSSVFVLLNLSRHNKRFVMMCILVWKSRSENEGSVIAYVPCLQAYVSTSKLAIFFSSSPF